MSIHVHHTSAVVATATTFLADGIGHDVELRMTASDADALRRLLDGNPLDCDRDTFAPELVELLQSASDARREKVTA